MSDQKLRVLHVLEATLGGTRRYLEDIVATTVDTTLVQGLVYGISRSDSGFPGLLASAQSNRWILYPVPPMRRPIHPAADAQSIALTRKAIRNFRPDILHVHSAKGGAIGRIAAQTNWPNAPRVIYSPHALPSRLGRSFMATERILALITSRFMAVSESERREIIAERIAPKTNIDVVYPRIDTGYFRPRNQQEARHQLGIPQNDPIVIGVGRLAPQKDPVGFVATIAQVRTSNPTVSGIWVGDGEMRTEVIAMAKQLGVSKNLQITGWVDDVRPYIAASDILLSTSRYESFGYVIPEAFSMERPVVASRITGTIDVVFPEAESLLYLPSDITQATIALRRLIDNEALRRELGSLGRASVMQRFSDSAMRTALCTSYHAVLT